MAKDAQHMSTTNAGVLAGISSPVWLSRMRTPTLHAPPSASQGHSGRRRFQTGPPGIPASSSSLLLWVPFFVRDRGELSTSIAVTGLPRYPARQHLERLR